MPEPSEIFKEHYAHYLRLMAGLDLDRIGPAAGAEVCPGQEKGSLCLKFFNRRYTISARGIADEEGRAPGYDTCIILSRYLIMAGDRIASPPSRTIPGETWTGFRDLRDSGPLTVYFRDNVETALARTLTGKTRDAGAGLAALGAQIASLDARYDLMLEFRGLPHIPMLLLFNDADDGFPPSASLLFRADVETHLDAECIAMLGYRLAALVRGCLKTDQV